MPAEFCTGSKRIALQLQVPHRHVGIRGHRVVLKFLRGILTGVLPQVVPLLIDSLHVVMTEHGRFIRIAANKNWDAHLSAMGKDSGRLLGNNPAIDNGVGGIRRRCGVHAGNHSLSPPFDDIFTARDVDAQNVLKHCLSYELTRSTEDPNGYALQRYLLHLDIHDGPWFRFYDELSSLLEHDRTGGPRPVIDEDQLDIHQGFFDVLLVKPRGASSLLLPVGRQELPFGSGRLVALREGEGLSMHFGKPVPLRNVLQDSAKPFTRAAEIARKEENK